MSENQDKNRAPKRYSEPDEALNTEPKTPEQEARKPEKSVLNSEALQDIEAPLDSADEDLFVAEPANGSKLGRYLLYLIALNIVVWSGFAIFQTLYELYYSHFMLFVPLSVSTLALVVTIIALCMRQYKALHSVDQLAQRNQKINHAIETNDLALVEEALKSTVEQISKRNPALIQQFNSAAAQRGTAASYVDLYINLVQTALDKEAKAVTRREILIGSAGVTVSNQPILDAGLILWRSVAVTHKVGMIYGLQPTGLSAVKLLKYAISSALFNAGTDAVTDLLVEGAGQSVIKRIFKSVGESSVAALRMYRIGKLAQNACQIQMSEDALKRS